MRNQLLRDNDVMSMSCGLELRVPLVDQVLIEAIASIPSQIRLALGKQLLIQAVNELPSGVINRPKKPFAFPCFLLISLPSLMNENRRHYIWEFHHHTSLSHSW
jgi:hypothetical protein